MELPAINLDRRCNLRHQALPFLPLRQWRAATASSLIRDEVAAISNHRIVRDSDSFDSNELSSWNILFF